MMPPFLQIHTLTGYAAVLLNRDDTGRAKRLPFGGCDRIRVSAQCLKRHWREAADQEARHGLGAARSTRSRRIVSQRTAGRPTDIGCGAQQVMATSHLLARQDSPVHVAHSFTVHAEQVEPDSVSTTDDLKRGAAHGTTTELTSGLFYGYVVVDLRQLRSHLRGDRARAAAVVPHLVRLVATVSPGAQRGATAPYAYADFVLAELGARQPRSLANAFRQPVPLAGDAGHTAAARLADHLEGCDHLYGPHEERRAASTTAATPASAGPPVPLAELASWAARHAADAD